MSNEAEFAKLGQLIARLESAGAGGARHKVGQSIALASHSLIQRGFARQQDPYGTPWVPRKKPGDGHPTLNKTGAMKRAFTVLHDTVRGVIFHNTKPYTEYHQDGTPKMVARKMFPDKGGLPTAWLATWDRVGMAAIAKFFQK